MKLSTTIKMLTPKIGRILTKALNSKIGNTKNMGDVTVEFKTLSEFWFNVGTTKVYLNMLGIPNENLFKVREDLQILYCSLEFENLKNFWEQRHSESLEEAAIRTGLTVDRIMRILSNNPYVGDNQYASTQTGAIIRCFTDYPEVDYPSTKDGVSYATIKELFCMDYKYLEAWAKRVRANGGEILATDLANTGAFETKFSNWEDHIKQINQWIDEALDGDDRVRELGKALVREPHFSQLIARMLVEGILTRVSRGMYKINKAYKGGSFWKFNTIIR